MPGLFGSDLKKDYLMFKELFGSPDFQPDMLKIYPTVVTKNSNLHKLWKAGKYKPLTDKKFQEFILKVKKEIIPPYVRIARLVRDIPEDSIVAGPKVSNLRQLIEKESVCQCIRCREVRADYEIKEKIVLDRIDYAASDGKEIFLQYVSPDKKKLFALLRLRITNSPPHQITCMHNTKNDIPSSNLKKLSSTSEQKEFWWGGKNSAIIREVHTYGKLAKIDKKDSSSPQHIGLGKKLIAEAEKIAKKEFNLSKIVVISGVGVRGYYRKLGYRLEDTYMTKKL